MLRTGLVGATGIVGQQFVVALQSHPWFQLTQLAASERSAGKSYRQALTDSGSGAFRWYCPETPDPGVLGLDILDNVVPYIPKEEEKVQQETQKVLGAYTEGEPIRPADFPVSCTCTRVNVLDGHTEAVFVSTKEKASVEEVKTAFREYHSGLEELGLPSAPCQLIVVSDDPYRPQPRLDRDTHGGMATTV